MNLLNLLETYLIFIKFIDALYLILALVLLDCKIVIEI